MIKRSVAAAIAVVIAVIVFCVVVSGEHRNTIGLVQVFSVISSAHAGEQVKQGSKPGKEVEDQSTGKGLAAINRAAKAQKYLFVFFYKDKNEQVQKMRKIFDATMQKVADRAESIAVDVTDPSEKGIVKKFKVGRAPMPLVLALASNGAITGGFPLRFDEDQLLGAFVSPGMEKTLKALQDSKYVFLCVQNAKTKQNDAAMRGVRDFKADTKYSKTTEIITLDPTDSAEAKLLKKFRVDPNIGEATTVFLMPPGKIVGTFKGATDKKALVAKLAACGTSCGPTGAG